MYTRLINLIGGTEVSDIANGYRAIRASRLAEIAFTEDQFHNPELLLGAARAGLRVVDVPVTIRRRSAGSSKKGTDLPLRPGLPAGDAQDLAALRADSTMSLSVWSSGMFGRQPMASAMAEGSPMMSGASVARTSCGSTSIVGVTPIS